MRIVHSLPLKSHIVVFGCESGENIHGLVPDIFIFHTKTLRGFNAIEWRNSLTNEEWSILDKRIIKELYWMKAANLMSIE